MNKLKLMQGLTLTDDETNSWLFKKYYYSGPVVSFKTLVSNIPCIGTAEHVHLVTSKSEIQSGWSGGHWAPLSGLKAGDLAVIPKLRQKAFLEVGEINVLDFVNSDLVKNIIVYWGYALGRT